MKTAKITLQAEIYDDPEFCGSLDDVCEHRIWDDWALQFNCDVFNKLLGDGIEKCDQCKEAWKMANTQAEVPFVLRDLKTHDCCADHCRDWRETENGKYPASDHSPGCHWYKQEKFRKLTIGGSWLIDTHDGIEQVIAGLDEDEDYQVEDVYLTRDQFKKLPEFEGF